MGVDLENCRKVAELVGIKTILNEFVAYQRLGVILENRDILDKHIASNGTWDYVGDDINVYTDAGTLNTTLVGGVLTVSMNDLDQ